MQNSDRKYFSLNHKIVFYVPSTNHATPITSDDFTTRTNEVAGLFSSWFGGASIESVKGFYKSETGEIITENVNKIVSFTEDKILDKKAADVLNLATQKAKTWQQETIGVEIDTSFFLVD